MNSLTRLLVFLAALVAVFGLALLAGRTFIPEKTVADWTREAEQSTAEHDGMAGSSQTDHAGTSAGSSAAGGLSVEQDGYRLTAVTAPAVAGEPGLLSFRILDPDGRPLTEYRASHEKDLHLIAVRSDGTGFQHVHPELRSGTWTVPVTWPEGGTYRIFADFVPADDPEASDLTLGHSVEVAGGFKPVKRPVSRVDSIDGFNVSVAGGLEAGQSSQLTLTVNRGGSPETRLQPYLGAFGHLVALREGDLAYLHVHPAEADQEPGSGTASHDHHGQRLSGPEIGFVAVVPTPGRYLLYLDFKVDGEVHTAEFVMEAG